MRRVVKSALFGMGLAAIVAECDLSSTSALEDASKALANTKGARWPPAWQQCAG